MTDTLDLSVVLKIQKLLALNVANGATEAEATSAAEKAAYLMAEYNITMATIEANGQPTTTDAGAARTRTDHVDRTVYKWRRELMKEIGRLNFCIVQLNSSRPRYNRPETFDGYTFFGRQANVAATRVMFDYLVSAIERLAREWAKDNGHNIFAKPAIYFREGAAERLIARLDTKFRGIVREQREKAEAARAANTSYSGSTMPAVILADYIHAEEDANADLRDGVAPGTHARLRRERIARSAAISAYMKEYNCSWSVAYDVIVQGFSHEKAQAMESTEQDRMRRLINDPAYQAKSDRSDRRYQERMYRESVREASKTASPGYRAGQEAGRTISLDPQVNSDTTRRIA